jgi:hypothetical protein
MLNCLSLLILSLLLLQHSAFGIINMSVPLGNTLSPTGLGSEPTDPGFDYVGKVNGSTGVYLGNGWVLTANHVGTGTFNLDGTNYTYNGVDSHQIGGADLRLFKLSTNPMLAPLTIATVSPTIAADVVMIGAGRSPTSATPTTWFVDTTPDPWLWEESYFVDADALLSGFETTSTKTKRWGTNVVEDLETVSYGTYAAMDMIVTDFDQVGGTAFESQAVTNDSGSALFVDNGSGWELAGTIVTVGNYSGQPGGASSAVFGNVTYAIDLSAYATEINSYVPESGSVAVVMGLVSGLLTTLVRRRV